MEAVAKQANTTGTKTVKTQHASLRCMGTCAAITRHVISSAISGLGFFGRGRWECSVCGGTRL